MLVGVLALQGGFAVHAEVLRRLGHEAVYVRKPAELDAIDGLILPGGESSTMHRLIDRSGLEGPLRTLVAADVPVLATCAGLILAARRVTHPEQESMGFLDLTVARNAWGRQLDSFEASGDRLGLPLVFIRAPRITETGPAVEVLETYSQEAVFVRQGNVFGATFHPELTEDLSIHEMVFSR